jgi:hypothetical protein
MLSALLHRLLGHTQRERTVTVLKADGVHAVWRKVCSCGRYWPL